MTPDDLDIMPFVIAPPGGEAPPEDEGATVCEEEAEPARPLENKLEKFRLETEERRRKADVRDKKRRTETEKRISAAKGNADAAKADMHAAICANARASKYTEPQRLVEHIKKTIGPQNLDSPPLRPSKIDWSQIKGGTLERYKAGWVWVPTGSTVEIEIKKYPNRQRSGWGVYAPKEIYLGTYNADQYIETSADRAYSNAERQAADGLGINPRVLLSDSVLDSDDNVFRSTLKPFMPDLLVAAIALARGVCLGEINDEGEMKKLYSVAPDKELLRYLTDQYFGRSPARGDSIGDDAKNSITLKVEEYA